MTVMKLAAIEVEKPWGRDALPAPFAADRDARIGEIWFPAPEGQAMPLLVKYLFTSEKLSIQVHPNDAQARERGLPAGKEECWYILDAEPGATLGMGTKEVLSGEALREASLSGAIEDLMEWHPVAPGMLFHIPPGTVHAIGPGIALIEVQQNIDVTYRLYDYGRPRELHLDDGVAVSKPEPFPASQLSHIDWSASAVVLATPHFKLAAIAGDDLSPLSGAKGQLSVIPIEGTITVDGVAIASGECALASPNADIQTEPGTRAFIAWPV